MLELCFKIDYDKIIFVDQGGPLAELSVMNIYLEGGNQHEFVRTSFKRKPSNRYS